MIGASNLFYIHSTNIYIADQKFGTTYVPCLMNIEYPMFVIHSLIQNINIVGNNSNLLRFDMLWFGLYLKLSIEND